MASYKTSARLENLDKIIMFIKSGANRIGFNKKQTYHIILASEEILTNIIKYAYRGKSGKVKTEYRQTKEKEGIEITFSDSGIAFNPLSLKKPDVTMPVEERDIGGLGIHLVVKTMYTVSYERKKNKNFLTITLYKDIEMEH